MELLFKFYSDPGQESAKQMANFDEEKARYLREHNVHKQAEA